MTQAKRFRKPLIVHRTYYYKGKLYWFFAYYSQQNSKCCYKFFYKINIYGK